MQALGTVGVGLLLTLLTGKALKTLLDVVLRKIAAMTSTKEDDRVVEAIEKDWGIDPPEQQKEEGK
jgi:hypothetical protein